MNTVQIPRLLFITPHLGGGVGKAIIGMCKLLMENGWTTTILLLEEPEKTLPIATAYEYGIEPSLLSTDGCVYKVKANGAPDLSSKSELEIILEQNDICIINWWEHPLMCQFLYNFPAIPMRLLGWMHINGCRYPYLDYGFLSGFDYVLFTSSYSYENLLWNEMELQEIQEFSDIVYGCGDFSPSRIKPNGKEQNKEAFPFVVGYAGTLSFAKMHPDFVQWSETALALCPDMTILMAGDVDNLLQKQVETSKYADRFRMLGYVSDMDNFWRKIDVLGYPLNPDNFGTTENIILEAMSYEIPVVCYSGGVERAILEQGKTGLVVDNAADYANAIKALYDDTALRHRLGKAARRKVCADFEGSVNAEHMNSILRQLMNLPKNVHSFQTILGETPFHWFLRFTGEDGARLLNVNERYKLYDEKPIYLAESKSSVKQFLKYFPDETILRDLLPS